MTKNPSATVKVWDLPVRLGHWSLALCFALAYGLQGDHPRLHGHAGYTIGLLILFRVLWGFAGTQHARWRDFWPAPGAVIAHLKQLYAGPLPPSSGHDPAGAAMICALLCSLTATVLSGLVLFAMEGSGPLAGTALGHTVSQWPGSSVARWHAWLADVSLALVVLHITGVAAASHRQRQNLVRAMVTGRKTR